MTRANTYFIFKERARRERDERERKRKAEERDKMTREQKLAQVRKEIEMRFQAGHGCQIRFV